MNSSDAKNADFAASARRMVESQIRARGIESNAVLQAMLDVPRHEFVMLSSRVDSYADCPLSIGFAQTISQPYIVAFMTEALELTNQKKVLEIGTGCGYQTAVLSKLARKVYSIEIVKGLCRLAKENLSNPDYDNIVLRCGDGYHGWIEHAPFDAIIVTAAPDHIPEPLLEQLSLQGTMIIPIGSLKQELIVIKKTADGQLKKQKLIPVRFVPMTGRADRK